MCNLCPTFCHKRHHHNYENKHHMPRIVKKEDSPGWGHDRFLTTGYRIQYTWADAFWSLFSLHNETLNIWTSLLTAIFYIVATIFIALVPGDMSPFEQGLFILFTVCAAYTFATSALFHWFCCLSSESFYNLARFDMSGIAVMIGGSMIVPLYYAFRCDSVMSNIYLISIITLTGSMIVLFLIPSLSTEHYRNLRICIFSAFGISGFVPIIHLTSFYGIFSNFLFERIKTVALMYGVYAVGLLFYFSRIPERFFRKTFDVIGHSHQIWHIAVTTASLIHFYNMYEFRNASIIRSCILNRLEP